MKKILPLLLTFVLFVSFTVVDIEPRISGIVVDETGEPIIGANIQIKGTTIGTVTDFDGRFSFANAPGDILIVSFIGYITQEIDISDKTTLRIVMKEDSAILDEVVVVGYGMQRMSSMVGAMAGVISTTNNSKTNNKAVTTTWKRSGMKDNSIRLQVGDNDYISLQAAQMAVQIDGFRVRVLMDCFFYNDKGSGLEGTFKLKLPTDATPFYFAFGETEYINEEKEDKQISGEIPYYKYSPDNFDLSYQGITDDPERYWRGVKEARIVSKQKAAKAYEQTVSASVDPALMEWGGADMFSCRVFPLSNNTLHQVVIGYDLNMTEALDFREYILSLPVTEKNLKLDIAIYDSPTLQSSISPELVPVDIKDNRRFYSLVNPKEKEYIVRYNSIEPVMLVESDDYPDGLAYYFAATYRVDLPEIPQENLPEDAVFMLDLSISSNPDKFNVWLKLVEEILSNNKDVIKRFAILNFNIGTNWYQKTFRKNNTYNLQAFMDYAGTLALEGATDLASALKEASNPSWMKPGENQPKHIFLLSDADCNWGETNMHTLGSLINPGDRIYTYKTGLSGTNSAVLNYLSKNTNGFAFTVTGEEEAKLTARSFRYKPWNIESIEVENAEDFLISGDPAQLYNGQKLILTGRDAPTGAILLNVSNGSEQRTLTYTAKEVIPSALTSRIYGQIATVSLESQGYMLEEATVNYSTFFRVPGLYTSFLMLESSYDYDEWGIDDYDADRFVSQNKVEEILAEYAEKGYTGNPGSRKEEFKNWLEKLSQSDVNLSTDGILKDFIESLPEETFHIALKPRKYSIWTTDRQTNTEQQLLSDEDLRFDNIYKQALRRASSHGKPEALKLLSSVVERNGGDLMTIRDVAMAAIDWGMGEHAYHLMRRIIDWRENEAIAYLTAAEALASAGYTNMALIYFYICLDGIWDSDYGDFREISALKCLKLLNEIKRRKNYRPTIAFTQFMEYLQDEVSKLTPEDIEDLQEVDIVVFVSWNINDTDIDLHVIEPTGEICYYGNQETEIGGKLSMDVTSGYGPEMYMLKKAKRGKYSISLDYYSDSGTQTASKAKAYIEIYRNWGRQKEKLTRKVVELKRYNDDDDDDDERKAAKKRTVMKFRVR